MLEFSSRVVCLPNLFWSATRQICFVVLIRATDFAHGLHTDACIQLLNSVFCKKYAGATGQISFFVLIEATDLVNGLHTDACN